MGASMADSSVLIQLVYAELRALARAWMAREKRGA
jgi:hypothetical protein